MKIKRLVVIPLLLFMAFPIFSHDYILVPEKFVYHRGDSLKVHLMVGDPFRFEFERELQYKMTDRFFLFTKNDSVNLLNERPDSSLPIVNRKIDFNGLGLITMHRRFAFIDEKPSAFQNYLREEKITGIDFDSTRWTKAVVKEKYSRCIKSLIVSEKSNNENVFAKIVGQPLEMQLLVDPYRIEPLQAIVMKVLWNGKPLAGHTVIASIQLKDGQTMDTLSVTRADGICMFPVIPNAIYEIHMVHMVRLPERSDADFESTWASFSFQVPSSGVK